MRKYIQINDWPLVFKLMGAMLVVTLVPLALVGLVNTSNTQRSLEQSVVESFGQQAERLNDRLNGLFFEQVSIVQSIALDDNLKNALEERNASYTGSEDEILAELLTLDDVWRSGTTTTPLIAKTLSRNPARNPVSFQLADHKEFFEEHIEIFVTDAFGGTVGSTDLLSDYYQADEGWWQATYNDGEGAVYISDPEFDESANATAMLIGVPVISEETGEILGIVRSTVIVDELFEIVGSIHIGQTGRAMVLDRTGNVIADPNGELADPESGLFLSETLVSHILEHGETLEVVDDFRDEYDVPTIFAHARLGFAEGGDSGQFAGTREGAIDKAIANLGWGSIIRQANSEAMAPVAAATRLSVLTLVIAALAAVGAAYGLGRLLTRQVDRIQSLFAAIGIGEFEARAEVLSGDELGETAVSLNAMLDNTLTLVQTREERDAMQASVQKLLDEVSGVGEGDLTVEAEVSPELTGAIADAFNYMIGQLRNIISNVQNATHDVGASANEIQAMTMHLSTGSESQATQISEASSAIEEMADSIQQVSENAGTSATVGEQALANARQGSKAVQNTVDGMNRIRDQVQETAKRIKRLGETSQEVGEIVQLIGDIADRTSILALNASIQAAMAGEAGQGFAVVAEEVERLAERSAEATKQIDTLIRTIQNETNEAVSAMEETTKEVVVGSGLADEAGRALSEIEAVSTRLAELSQSISLAAKQQARGSETLAKSMGDIASVTQQTAAGTKQAAVSISSLAGLADELRASVSTFKLPGENGNAPLESDNGR